MGNQTNGKWAHVLQYGLASAIAGIAVVLLVYLFDINQQFNNLIYLAYLTFLIFALFSWRKKRGDLGMSYGNSFGYSMLMALAVSVFLAIWYILFIKVIAPGLAAEILEMQHEAYRKQGISEVQIEKMKIWEDWLMSVLGIFLVSLIREIFIFTLINLITAAFFTRKPASPVDPSHIPANNPYSPFQSSGPPSDHA